MFLKISKKSQKTLCQSLFFNKVAGRKFATLSNKDSGRDVFLWILWNFSKHSFWRTSADDYFYTKEISVLSKKFNDQNAKWVSYCKKLLGKY